MNTQPLKTQIKEALQAFRSGSVRENALKLLSVLGYRSDRTLDLDGSPGAFLSEFDTRDRKFRRDKALFKRWKSIDFLFQLTADEISASASQGKFALDSSKKFNGQNYRSYLFFALNLKPGHYTRTNFSDIAREINLLFDMPAMLLIRTATTLTIAIINRRLSKKDATRDVIRKVTLIREINCNSPHRAHIDILFDLSLPVLCKKYNISDFLELHEAWRKTLDIQALNNRFFKEVRNWFYWARIYASFPKEARKDAEGLDSESLIRLLTRLIFCWFLREMALVPDDLFRAEKVSSLLRNWNPQEDDDKSRYYKAILQNLFFATLNTPLAERRFRTKRSYQGRNKDYGDHSYFRYCQLFRDEAKVEDLYRSIPFLNGGLFECLDRIPGRDAGVTKEVRVDGFSDVKSKQPLVPDFLFFDGGRDVREFAQLSL